MKKDEKKSILKVVFGLAGLYILLIVFVPYLTLSATAGSLVTSIYDHFAMMKTNLVGDVHFLLLVIGMLVALYYFMIYRPKHPGKGKRGQQITTARQWSFYALVAYGILLVIFPYITLAVTAQPWLVTIYDHFTAVKTAIASDFSFLALAAGLLYAGYYFMVYKPKLSR